jgi:hypothetical protein
MLATQTLVAGILPLVYILWDFNRTNILNCRDPDNCGMRGTLPGPDVLGLLSEKGVVQYTGRGFLLLMKWRFVANPSMWGPVTGTGTLAPDLARAG